MKKILLICGIFIVLIVGCFALLASIANKTALQPADPINNLLTQVTQHHPYINSIMIKRGNRFLLEHYTNGYDSATLHPLQSGQLRSRDMIKLGELYLQNCNGDESRLLDSSCIKSSWQAYAHGYSSNNTGYGYLWKRSKIKNEPVRVASGFGGQFIIAFPRLSAIVAISCDLNSPRDPVILQLVADFILPVIS